MSADDSDSQIPMNDKEKRKLALSEVILIVLGLAGIATVIWLAWLRD